MISKIIKFGNSRSSWKTCQNFNKLIPDSRVADFSKVFGESELIKPQPISNPKTWNMYCSSSKL